MTLENQVCSLELAKRLKELGVKQDGSLFVHLKTKHAKGVYFAADHIRNVLSDPGVNWCAAWTVAELGEMLPSRISSYRLGLAYACEGGESSGCLPDYKVLVRDTEADSRAAMLIYLIEQGIIKA